MESGEGKIKADGTTLGHRAKSSWSAHWLRDGARHRPKRGGVPLFCETSMPAQLFVAPRPALPCFCVDWLEQRR